MNTRRFVSGSSLILAGWLAATFFYETPSQRYPKLDKSPATAALGSKIQDKVVLPTAAVSAPVSH